MAPIGRSSSFQQIVGALLLVPFLAFAVALDRRAQVVREWKTRWLILAGLLFAAAEVATNVPPLVVAAMAEPSPSMALTVTRVEDLADAGLFVSIALFSIVAALAESAWARVIGLVMAALTLVRALASPLGLTVLDSVAPIAFLALVLVLSGHILLTAQVRRA